MISEQYTKLLMVDGKNTWRSKKSKSLSQLRETGKGSRPGCGWKKIGNKGGSRNGTQGL